MGKAIDGAVSVGAEILRVAKDNPDAKAAGRNLAKAARTVTDTVNVVLLPLAALNYGAKRAKQYFESKFPDEMGELLATIPDGELVEPKASVAGPALQGLAFSHDEEELKALYLELLKSSMDQRVASQVHPAFAEIIRQLAADEVGLLESAMQGHRPVAELIDRADAPGEGYRSLIGPVVSMSIEGQEGFARQDNFARFATNWSRLGLIDISFSQWFTSAGAYDWVTRIPEYTELAARLEPGRHIDSRRGVMAPTPFGTAFAKAVGIVD